MKSLKPRVKIVQPALPHYRRDFFERLFDHYGSGFTVYYSPEDMGAITATEETSSWEKAIGPLRKFSRGLEWQVGALSIPVKRGDVVVVCGAPRAISTLLLLLKIRLRGASSIWWGQYWTATSKNWRFKLRMKLIHLADAVLFYMEDEVRRFDATGLRHRGQVGALNNGIRTTEIQRHRAPYDAKARGQNILFIGRLTEKANLSTLLKALSEPQLESLHLHVIGDGNQQSKLCELAESLGVQDNITWYGPLTDEAEIAPIANKCAVFVYPGQVGLSLIHAMAYGLPVVVHSNRLHHMPEIAAFKPDENGAEFEESSDTSLMTTLSDLLQRPAERELIAQRNATKIVESFSTEVMARRFISLLDDLEK